MCHTLSNEHKNMSKEVQEWKKNNKKNKEEFFLILEKPVLNLILKSDITATSQMLLVVLLSKLQFNNDHLYIFLPYKDLEEEGFKKATAVNSLKDLESKGLIKLHSGTNRKANNEIKEFLFKDKQYFNPLRNCQNIIEMTPFYNKLFKV